MLGSDRRVQRVQKPPTAHHLIEGLKGMFPMQLQTQVGRQHKLLGHLLLLAGREHRLGQPFQKVFPETELEECFLIGLAQDFQTVKVLPAEICQHPVGMRFKQFQVHGVLSGGQRLSRCCAN